MVKENFINIYESGFVRHWELPALSDYKENSDFKYKDLAAEIEKIHLLLGVCKIKQGDKISLIGKNSSRWCITYLGVITYGAIIVPILQDFSSNDVHHIINHSESVLLFAADSIWETLEEEKLPKIRAAFSLSDFHLLYQRKGCKFENINLQQLLRDKYPDGLKKEDVKYPDIPNENVIVISYTSGTTGFSKGVMTTANNLAGNITFAQRMKILQPGQKMLSMLPLAHAYGCAFEFLYPLSEGCHVTFLGKTPSPNILLKAFESVKPHLIIAVPLILEKIYRKMIVPQLNKNSIQLALKIPGLNSLIYGKIKKKLIEAFGGRFDQVIIGGAPLNAEVEAFFFNIKFPFTIGYGMTECAPLVSYAPSSKFVPGSCGRILDIMEVRIDSEDPYQTVGEIQVRGENVMQGYYKNEEATRNAFTEDGWLKTGDLGTIDAAGRIFIRGRSKDMLLSANGQNIYPEEIEAKLNNLPFVMESLIIQKDNKLIALVYPDYEEIDKVNIEHDKLPQLMEETLKTINTLVAPYERISEIRLFSAEFEKTPKKSIKRYLYINHNH
jgi:Long-chain acyl-CoA synthetases (AMP-forming)